MGAGLKIEWAVFDLLRLLLSALVVAMGGDYGNHTRTAM